MGSGATASSKRLQVSTKAEREKGRTHPLRGVGGFETTSLDSSLFQGRREGDGGSEHSSFSYTPTTPFSPALLLPHRSPSPLKKNDHLRDPSNARPSPRPRRILVLLVTPRCVQSQGETHIGGRANEGRHCLHQSKQARERQLPFFRSLLPPNRTQYSHPNQLRSLLTLPSSPLWHSRRPPSPLSTSSLPLSVMPNTRSKGLRALRW
jgi:hypothetical protein